MLGGWPSHIVWTITCTSEMSGNASSGMWPRDQMPAKTRSKVPVKTRKRFRAHQSIHRAITLHSPFGIHAQGLLGHGLSALLRHDGDLPGSSALQFPLALVTAVAFVRAFAHRTHRCHSHC